MAEKILWVTVGMAVFNYLIRSLPFAFFRGREVPEWVSRWLEFIPVAVLAAVLAQSLFWQDDGMVLAGNRYLVPAVLTLIFAARVRSLTWTLLFGMAVMAISRGF